tara:strand:+ start:105 stop:440 length:336 start_codon:yes stop_codon:yes gene_type:complete
MSAALNKQDSLWRGYIEGERIRERGIDTGQRRQAAYLSALRKHKSAANVIPSTKVWKIWKKGKHRASWLIFNQPVPVFIRHTFRVEAGDHTTLRQYFEREQNRLTRNKSRK